MRASNILVFNLGLKGDKYPARAGKRIIKEYAVWQSMLERCTEKHWWRRPSYIGTSCSENFKSYTFFYEWCNKQVGFNSADENGKRWCLDKDILASGNKIYSEDTCCFVPQRVNNLIVKSEATRGDCPIGVSFDKKQRVFKTCCRGRERKTEWLGRFNTLQEAFQAYKTFKEALIKEVAEEYKSQLDPRAYQALINYEVNIND